MKLGFAICGSFCNHPEILKIYESLSEQHELIPILSENAAKYDTRFGTAEHLVERVESLAGRRAVRSIVEAEPLGPSNAMDALVIAPCTGNTISKLAAGVTDGPVTMAAKSHLRNGKPVVVALATNDGLSASAAGSSEGMAFTYAGASPQKMTAPPLSIKARSRSSVVGRTVSMFATITVR